MAYQPRANEPAPVEPARGSLTGYAAIKYTALVIIVLAIIGFLVWPSASSSTSPTETPHCSSPGPRAARARWPSRPVIVSA